MSLARGGLLLGAVRIGLPLGICLAGVVLMVFGNDKAMLGAGIVLVGVGLLVALLNVLMRLGLESERDREREEWARDYFVRHRCWPGRRSGPRPG